MKILITGGTGYIGSHTIVELINTGYDVVVVDNFSNSKPIVLDRLKEITGQEINFYELDVCDKWYKYELNETTFLKKINEYKKTQEENKDNNNQSKIQIIFNNIVNFLKSYFIYIIIFIVIVCSITIYITIRKKKYSLE